MTAVAFVSVSPSDTPLTARWFYLDPMYLDDYYNFELCCVIGNHNTGRATSPIWVFWNSINCSSGGDVYKSYVYVQKPLHWSESVTSRTVFVEYRPQFLSLSSSTVHIEVPSYKVLIGNVIVPIYSAQVRINFHKLVTMFSYCSFPLV